LSNYPNLAQNANFIAAIVAKMVTDCPVLSHCGQVSH